MAARLETPEWNVPARVVRGGVVASVVASTVLDMVGRWSELVLSIRAPAAWNAAHVLTVRATSRGASPAVEVVTMDALEWQTLDDGQIEAVVTVGNRPAEGFAVEVMRGAALPDPGEAIFTAEARAPEAGTASSAERADLEVEPRALPQIQIVAMGYDGAGKLRAVAVDASGALVTA